MIRWVPSVLFIYLSLLACGGSSAQYRSRRPVPEGPRLVGAQQQAVHSAAEPYEKVDTAEMALYDVEASEDDDATIDEYIEPEARPTSGGTHRLGQTKAKQAKFEISSKNTSSHPRATDSSESTVTTQGAIAQAQVSQSSDDTTAGSASAIETASSSEVASSPKAPLLVYEAELHLAVYQVEDKQREIIDIANKAGGFLARQDDTSIIVRIPKARFYEALADIEKIGDVLHKQVNAQDVTEQYRDLEIRIKNAERVRERLLALLDKANNVTQSLAVEREIERLTKEIELLKGKLKFLSDRVAYSTITVRFSAKPIDIIDKRNIRLPYEWLYDLGLSKLLELDVWD